MAVQSVDRALDLMELIGEQPGGLVDLSQRADLAPSTASRLLGALTDRGAVHRDDDGAYHLGPLVHRLASTGSVSPVLIETRAAETVAELAIRLDEAACISIPVGSETLTVTQSAVSKPVQAQDWTGHRWPITGGGSGAVMMATWPTQRVEPILARLDAATRASVASEIASARAAGISWSHGTYVEGLSSVAAPILGPDGTAVAAVLGYGPSYRFPAEGREATVATIVAEAGATITRLLED
jgi:DNA-binding IclR family transcriptional regulator